MGKMDANPDLMASMAEPDCSSTRRRMASTVTSSSLASSAEGGFKEDTKSLNSLAEDSSVAAVALASSERVLVVDDLPIPPLPFKTPEA